MADVSLAEILKEKLFKTTAFFDAETNHILSGRALWRLAHSRRHELRSSGLMSGDIYICTAGNSLQFAIDFFACVVGKFRFFPIAEKDEALISQAQQVLREYPEAFCFLASSGTLKKKVVALSAASLLWQIQSHHSVLKLKSNEARLCLMSWNHSFGFVLDFLLGIFSEQILILPASKNPQHLHDLILEYQVKHFAMVPRQVQYFLNYVEQTLTLASLEQVVLHYGGGYLETSLKERAKLQFSEVIEGYGLTEAGPGVLLGGQVLPGIQVRLEKNTLDLDRSWSKLYVKTPSEGHWLEKNLSIDGFFCSDDNFEISGDNFKWASRCGDDLKLTTGEWTTRHVFVSAFAKRWNLDAVDFNLVDRKMNILCNNSALDIDLLQADLLKKLGYPIELLVAPKGKNFDDFLVTAKTKSTELSIASYIKSGDFA